MHTSVRSPAPEDAVRLIESGLEAAAFVTAVGACTVATGDEAAECAQRQVLIKPGGAVVVHDAAGIAPAATRPPGEPRRAATTAEGVVFRAGSPKSGPDLVVTFDSITRLSVINRPGAGAETVTETVTEGGLKTLVLEQPAVVESGFRPVATERQTAAGPVDIYGEDEAGRSVAVELKRQRAGPAAVGQLSRYVKALREELHTEATVRGILVAPSVTDRAHRRLARSGLEFVAVSPTQLPP